MDLLMQDIQKVASEIMPCQGVVIIEDTATWNMKFSRHENFANLPFWPLLAPNPCMFLHTSLEYSPREICEFHACEHYMFYSNLNTRYSN